MSRTDQPDERGIVPRSPEVLQLLSPEYRWEFTRRHTYYLLFWKAAAGSDNSAEADSGSVEAMLKQAAQLMLANVNFVGQPISPGTSFAEIDEQELPHAWRSGAISPISIRNIFTGLTSVLPGDTQQAFAELLLQDASITEGDSRARFELFSRIARGDVPGFDQALPGVGLYINPRAPMRAILSAVEEHVRELKQDLGITETRRRDDKLPEYLEVWDQREGWTGEAYDPTAERTLREISQNTGKPVQTVANRYARAFEYLIGHPFDPLLWARVVGLAKVAGFLGNGICRCARRRAWSKRQRKVDVPDSVVTPVTDNESLSLLARAGTPDEQLSVYELLIDIESLLDRGWEVPAICEELELGKEGPPLVKYLHDHRDDLSSLISSEDAEK